MAPCCCSVKPIVGTITLTYCRRVVVRRVRSGVARATVCERLNDLPAKPPGPFASIVHQTISLACAWQEANAKQSDESSANLLELPRTKWLPEKRTYVDFVRGQPASTLRRLQTLLHFGRDERKPSRLRPFDKTTPEHLHSLHDSLFRHEASAELALKALLEKRPDRVAEYLHRGLARAKSVGLDLERSFGVRFPS